MDVNVRANITNVGQTEVPHGQALKLRLLDTLSGAKMPLHCPRCRKDIDKAKVEEIDSKLMGMFQNDSLRRGVCPFCQTPLIDTDKKVKR